MEILKDAINRNRKQNVEKPYFKLNPFGPASHEDQSMLWWDVTRY